MYSHTGFYGNHYVYDVLHLENKQITLCKNLVKKSSVNCSLMIVQHVVMNKLTRRVMSLLRQIAEARDKSRNGKAQKLTHVHMRAHHSTSEYILDMITTKEYQECLHCVA